MNIDTIWGIIEPYVTQLFGGATIATVTYTIVRILVGRFAKKTTAALDASYNVEKVSQSVVSKLAGKTMNIDVTAIAEKKLDEVGDFLNKKVVLVENTVNELKGILIPMAKAMTKYKALTDEEKKDLICGINGLEKNYTPSKEEEPITVVLEPIDLADSNAEIDSENGDTIGVTLKGA